jgi:sRNA-binding protein
MGQNNDPTERGDLQGNQGGLLSKDPEEHKRLRQKEEGYARSRERRDEKPPSR